MPGNDLLVWRYNQALKKESEFHQQFEWDLTNGPLSKLLELLDTQV